MIAVVSRPDHKVWHSKPLQEALSISWRAEADGQLDAAKERQKQLLPMYQQVCL